MLDDVDEGHENERMIWKPNEAVDCITLAYGYRNSGVFYRMVNDEHPVTGVFHPAHEGLM